MLNLLKLLTLLTAIASVVSHRSVDYDGCPTTGSNCVRSCVGLRNGNYQSCLGCDVFVICKKSFLRDNNPCPLHNGTDNTYWDDIKRECTTEKSKTCIVDEVKEPEVVDVDNEPNGAIYTRWGKNNCPGNATLIYKGFTSKSAHYHLGSGADFICLTDEPIFKTENEVKQTAYVYGTEYEGGPLHDEDVGCAVCQTQRRNVLMIPGRDECYPRFTLEYAGYLATTRHTDNKATHICVDRELEPSTHSQPGNNQQSIFTAAESRCGSLPCSIYPGGKDLLCAVCSR